MTDPHVLEIQRRQLEPMSLTNSARYHAQCRSDIATVLALLIAQAAQLETVRQFVEAWREEADTEAKDRGPAWVGAEAALRRCADELEHVFARVASLEAGAAPTGKP